jgi:hypothetical protein
MFEFVLLDSHQCNRFLGEPAMSNFYPRLPRKSRLKLYKATGGPLCNQTVNGYRDCIEGGCLVVWRPPARRGEIYMRSKFLL